MACECVGRSTARPNSRRNLKVTKKQHIAALLAVLASFAIGSASAAERSVRFVAPADVLERLDTEDHEAALARFLAQADLASADRSGMAVMLEASNRASEGRSRAIAFRVQYHPSRDRGALLLRVTAKEPTATSRTMMDLEYRRVPDSPDFQLVGWRQLGLADSPTDAADPGVR